MRQENAKDIVRGFRFAAPEFSQLTMLLDCDGLRYEENIYRAYVIIRTNSAQLT